MGLLVLILFRLGIIGLDYIELIDYMELLLLVINKCGNK